MLQTQQSHDTWLHGTFLSRLKPRQVVHKLSGDAHSSRHLGGVLKCQVLGCGLGRTVLGTCCSSESMFTILLRPSLDSVPFSGRHLTTTLTHSAPAGGASMQSGQIACANLAHIFTNRSVRTCSLTGMVDAVSNNTRRSRLL